MRTVNLAASINNSFLYLSFPDLGGSWVWNVTEKAKSLLVQREASTLNTLLFIYLILWVWQNQQSFNIFLKYSYLIDDYDITVAFNKIADIPFDPSVFSHYLLKTSVLSY